MPLEVHELRGSSNRADRSIPAFIYCGVELGVVCLHVSWLWRLCSVPSVKWWQRRRGIYLNIWKT